jgi:N-acetylmuramoyl-L-alanine amidase
MASYPGAVWKDVGNSSGPYKGGPMKICLHTTEGGSADGAFSAYANSGCFPHFTVDSETVYQHLDTDTAASAVLNESGGVETNRLGAIQIEMVGYADDPKSHAMLALVAELCAWLEAEHGIPSEWPNGRPQGKNGPHNRSSSNWTSKSGWYGHSQVPENSHYDPGYLSDEELDILMGGKPVNIKVNGADQTGTIGAWMSRGNSTMDISDWCAYSGYAVPTWDNVTDTVSISTQKVRCQARLPDGAWCQNPSVTHAEFPLPGGVGSIYQWVCSDHVPPAAERALPFEEKP